MDDSDPELRALNQGRSAPRPDELREAAPPVADEALAAAAIEDRSAYTELYRRYVTSVYSYFAWRFGRDRAEDLTSETFVRTLDSLRRFDASRNWRAWLFGLARNVASEYLRRRIPEPGPFADPPERIDETPGPEDSALDAERATLARTLVATLPAAEQELIALRFWAGLSYREIAAVLGISEGATRVRVHRVLEKIRKRMEARR